MFVYKYVNNNDAVYINLTAYYWTLWFGSFVTNGPIS